MTTSRMSNEADVEDAEEASVEDSKHFAMQSCMSIGGTRTVLEDWLRTSYPRTMSRIEPGK